MTRREASLVGWFAVFIGGSVLAFSVYGALLIEAPQRSNSSISAALMHGLSGLFGSRGGIVAYYSIYAVVGAVLLWIGLKILRGRSS